MKQKSLLPQRHETLLYRLCDLAGAARDYSQGELTAYERMRRLRVLASEALRYAASVRTIARK